MASIITIECVKTIIRDENVLKIEIIKFCYQIHTI